MSLKLQGDNTQKLLDQLHSLLGGLYRVHIPGFKTF